MTNGEFLELSNQIKNYLGTKREKRLNLFNEAIKIIFIEFLEYLWMKNGIDEEIYNTELKEIKLINLKK